jgi:hypothetical protein
MRSEDNASRINNPSHIPFGHTVSRMSNGEERNPAWLRTEDLIIIIIIINKITLLIRIIKKKIKKKKKPPITNIYLILLA